jgi:hypothetical protein
MTDLLEKALSTVQGWTPERQEEAAEILLALDRLGSEPYSASEDELLAIDEALAQIEAGQIASDTEVAEAFSRFRR